MISVQHLKNPLKTVKKAKDSQEISAHELGLEPSPELLSIHKTKKVVLRASRNSVLEAKRGLRGCSHRSSKILKITFANFLNLKVNDLRGLSAAVKQKVFWRPNVASEAVQIEMQK